MGPLILPASVTLNNPTSNQHPIITHHENHRNHSSKTPAQKSPKCETHIQPPSQFIIQHHRNHSSSSNITAITVQKTSHSQTSPHPPLDSGFRQNDKNRRPSQPITKISVISGSDNASPNQQKSTSCSSPPSM